MATSITGCSGKTTEETAVEETAETEEAPEEEAVEEPVYETRQYTVEVATANEDGTFTAYDADGKQYVLTLATELSDDEKALVVPEACLIVSTEVQVGTKLVVNGEEVSTTGEDAEENADAELATEENTEESADSAKTSQLGKAPRKMPMQKSQLRRLQRNPRAKKSQLRNQSRSR